MNQEINGQAYLFPNRRPTEQEAIKIVQAYVADADGNEGTWPPQDGTKFTRGATMLEKIGECFSPAEVISTLVPKLAMDAFQRGRNELASAARHKSKNQDKEPKEQEQDDQDQAREDTQK